VAVDADAAITMVTSMIAMTIGRLIVDPLGALDDVPRYVVNG
jgi:hypothetical protein